MRNIMIFLSLALILLGLPGTGMAQAVYSPPASAPTISAIPGLSASLAQLQARTGKPVVVSSYNSSFPPYANLQLGASTPLLGTTSTTAVLARIKITCPLGAINPQPLYVNVNTGTPGENSYNGLSPAAPGGTNATPVTLSFAVEDSAGNIYPGTFNGRRTTTLDNGGPFVGDAVPIVVPAGGFFYERAMLTFAAGSNNFPCFSYSATNTTSLLTGATATPSTTDPATATAPSGGLGYYFGAAGWVGQQVTPGPAIVVQGDSRMGVADPTVSGSSGYFRQIFAGQVGLLSGDFSGNGYHTLQSTAGLVRSKIYYYATHTYIEHGTNDQSGTTATQIGNNLIGYAVTEIRKAVGFGAKVVLETIAPTLGVNSPLSGAADVPTNQLSPATDMGRRCYNDWIRGASVATLNANYAGAGIVLPGTTPTAAQAGMTSYVEMADLFETNNAGVLTRNGGYWRVPSAPYLSGTATGGTATTVTGTGFGATSMANMVIKFTSGANAGLYALVSASTTTSITFGAGVNAAGTATTITAPANGDTFAVYAVYTSDFRHESSNTVNGVRTIIQSGILNASVFN